MQMGTLLMEPALKVVQEHAMKASMEKTRIVTAQLGENAGLVGAGALPFYYQEQLKTRQAGQVGGEERRIYGSE